MHFIWTGTVIKFQNRITDGETIFEEMAHRADGEKKMLSKQMYYMRNSFTRAQYEVAENDWNDPQQHQQKKKKRHECSNKNKNL